MKVIITNAMVARFLLESFDPTAMPYKAPTVAETIITVGAIEDIFTAAFPGVQFDYEYTTEASVTEWRRLRKERYDQMLGRVSA